ncbi:MAG: hypothetical protein ACM3U2_03760, partial [Deltaproteobacteria bacterium]
LNREYRALLQQMFQLQTELLLGRNEEVSKLGETASQHLATANRLVAARRDFYLFEDEPAVDEEGERELKLTKHLAAPFSDDVQQHHEALRALALYRLSRIGDPTCETLLKEGLAGDTSRPAGEA